MQEAFGVKTCVAFILVALLVFATVTSTPVAFAAKPDKGNGNGNGNANGNGNGNGNSNGNSNGNGNGNGNNEEEPSVSTSKRSSGCKGQIIITNDLTVRGKCVIYDFQPPKITDVMLTPSNHLCVRATDDTGLASVKINDVKIPKRPGAAGTFCLTDITQKHIVTPTEANFGGILTLKEIGLAIQTTAKAVNLIGSMRLTVTDLAGNVAGGEPNYWRLLGSPSSFEISSAPWGGSVRHFGMLKEVEQPAHEHYTYSCSVDDDKHVITKTEGKIVIKNLSDQPLKNVRIYSQTIGKPFMLDQNKISSIPAYGELTVTLISKVPNSDTPLHYEGQLIIAPANALPMTIPIDIK